MEILFLAIEIIIIVVIIVIQVMRYYFPIKKGIKRFNDIFPANGNHDEIVNSKNDTPRIETSSRNEVHANIVEEVNIYVKSNKGGVLNFDFIKDTINRHCESEEYQIEAQLPIPLYLGLAGSMSGIFLGLIALSVGGSFSSGVGVDSGDISSIGNLLFKVAIAMLPGLIGLVITARFTQKYKSAREQGEKGKNQYISWLQSHLLPRLPNDTSSSLVQMADRLNKFNKVFEKNTATLANTFKDVNESYATQAQIIETVANLDMAKIAKSNIKVWEALQHGTDRIEQFNEYLQAIYGYTETIQEFNEQFQQQENQLSLLKEIRDFFKSEFGEVQQRRRAIEESMHKVDRQVENTMVNLNDHTESMAKVFARHIEEISHQQQEQLRKVQEQFNEQYLQLNERFTQQLKQAPALNDQLRLIADIPAQLSELSKSIQDSTQRMVQDVKNETKKRPTTLTHTSAPSSSSTSEPQAPQKMRAPFSLLFPLYLLTLSMLLMALHTLSPHAWDTLCSIFQRPF